MSFLGSANCRFEFIQESSVCRRIKVDKRKHYYYLVTIDSSDFEVPQVALEAHQAVLIYHAENNCVESCTP